MFVVILRKMFQNLWLSLCLLLGFTLSIAVVSSIPMFTSGAAFNAYTKSLRDYQAKSGAYPGGGLTTVQMNPKFIKNYNEKYTQITKHINEDLVGKIGLPLLSSTQKIQTSSQDLFLFNDAKSNIRMAFSSLNKLEDHVNILSGRIYNKEAGGGVIEAVITVRDMLSYKLALNKTYDVKGGKSIKWNEDDKYALHLQLKIVGIIEPKEDTDLYWYYNFVGINGNPIFYMDQSVFMERFVGTGQEPILAVEAQWYSAFDYNKISQDGMENIKAVSDMWSGYLKRGIISNFDMPMKSMYDKYILDEKNLKNIMWLFNILLLIILAFYILMISKLIIEYDKNEIALITSRGGGKLHILKGYLIQGFITGIISLLAGPFLGIFVCRIIGASNSFLEFSNRKAIPAQLSPQVYLYSLLALIAFLLVMLITSTLFSNTTIVEYKQGKARMKNKYINISIFVSIALLAFAFYWLYSYKSFVTRAGGSWTNMDGMPIDPLLFLNAAVFIIGAGLFITNLFPYLIRLVFQVGKKIWPPSVFTAFVQIGRSAGQEQFLMLFIVLTLSIGIFSANSARTININAIEKIRYQTGTDISVKGGWDFVKDMDTPTSEDEMAAGLGSKQAKLKIDKYNLRKSMGILNDRYIEPDFKLYKQIPGVEKATKVYVEEGSKIVMINNSPVSNVKLMGINSKEFGETAWFRPQLLPYHWYEYLNLLSDTPEGVLLSRSFEKNNKLKIGDNISLIIAGRTEVKVIVCDFIDYWPSFDPKIDAKADNNLVVANLGFLYNNVPIQPYQVWIRKKTSASSADINKAMLDKKMKYYTFTDADTIITQMKKEPAMLGTNGSLTLGFILTMLISLNGFLIYWVMSLKKRSLQFGIMRSMGIPSKNIIGMLSLEHFMTSGSAIITGIAIGELASRIFIPLYELFYSGGGQNILPFRVISMRSDYIRLYAVVGVMLLIALSILFVITKNVKITQAVKLGED